MKMHLIYIGFFISMLGCSSVPFEEGYDQYTNLVEKHSAGDKQFAGLYHNFEFRATILNEEMSKALHERLKLYYEWDKVEADADWQKRSSELNESTKFWLSFFTSERKNDNLANKNSIWKIYLETNGKRYEGRALKANKNFAEANALFEYHSRWATGYYIDFPVPAREVGSQAKLIITGPLGKREVTFN
jgi:hypothetical protein